MKKIGILTFWGVPNYGAWTQAYALNNLVRTMMGDEYDVRHINYLHSNHFTAYYKNNEKLRNNFTYSYDKIAHTERLSAEQLECEEFDIIITGSDAIWEFSVKGFGNDMHLIGNNLNAKKLIAYAPSFGTMTQDMNFETWMKEGLEQYHHLSVRDGNSANIVKKLIGIEPQIVLDPALLWNFKNDRNVVEPFIDSYILVYGINWSEEFISGAQQFAREKNCRLVSVGYTNKWCDLNFRMTELRCLEWIGMFKNAEYVITSTFHGLMLSLAFEKQVKFYACEYVQNRSQTLLKSLGIDMQPAQDLFGRELNYTQINRRLKELKADSLRYLEKAILEE